MYSAKHPISSLCTISDGISKSGRCCSFADRDQSGCTRKQAAFCAVFAPIGLSCGTSLLHLSITCEQREANAQPVGCAARPGTSPSTAFFCASLFCQRATGTDWSNPCV